MGEKDPGTHRVKLLLRLTKAMMDVLFGGKPKASNLHEA